MILILLGRCTPIGNHNSKRTPHNRSSFQIDGGFRRVLDTGRWIVLTNEMRSFNTKSCVGFQQETNPEQIEAQPAGRGFVNRDLQR